MHQSTRSKRNAGGCHQSGAVEKDVALAGSSEERAPRNAQLDPPPVSELAPDRDEARSAEGHPLMEADSIVARGLYASGIEALDSLENELAGGAGAETQTPRPEKRTVFHRDCG